MAPASLWLLCGLVLPLLLILALSLTRRGPYGMVVWEFSLGNYAKILDAVYAPVLGRSLVYAATTTFLCLVLGYGVAYTLSFYAGRRREMLIVMIMLPFWTSCLVAIYSWIILLGREGLINNLLIGLGLIETPIQFLNRPFAVILGLVYFYLPFMVLPLYACLEKIPRALIEAAKDLGATPRSTFTKVTLPLSMPGIAAGCLLTFIPCAGDFLTAEFLGGPRTYLIGNLIQNQFMVAQDWAFGSAVAVVLIAVLLIGFYGYLRLEGSGFEAGRV
ncbi:MAG: ABC transporter permease [Elusimicrobia bacterium]|nr:ABC transporter permease [Elusimicrobiota bacterium]